MQIQGLRLFQKQYVYSSSPLLFFYGLHQQKNLFWKIHCAPNKTIQEKYSLQSLCTINQKDNSPSLTHIILPLQTSFMSSPPRADIQLANLIVREGPTK